MARYTSPPGTYEPLRKELLEDPALTDAEARLIIYLATKPDGWGSSTRCSCKPRSAAAPTGSRPP